MNLEAQLLGGVPPYGRGVFCRGSVPPGPWRWCAVVADANAATDVAAARARGLEIWLYLGENAWTPDTWEASLATIVRHARELGVIRIIVDPESMAHDRAAMLALGRALEALLSDFIVCVTSYPSAANLDAVALGGRVGAIVQIYGRSSQNPADFARWFARWESIFGAGRVIVAIAGWHSAPTNGGTSVATNASTWAAYLAGIPAACGVAVWYEGNAPLSFVLAQLEGYEPGGSAPGTLALALRSFAARPIGAGVIGGGALVVALAIAVGVHFGGAHA